MSYWHRLPTVSSSRHEYYSRIRIMVSNWIVAHLVRLRMDSSIVEWIQMLHPWSCLSTASNSNETCRVNEHLFVHDPYTCIQVFSGPHTPGTLDGSLDSPGFTRAKSSNELNRAENPIVWSCQVDIDTNLRTPEFNAIPQWRIRSWFR